MGYRPGESSDHTRHESRDAWQKEKMEIVASVEKNNITSRGLEAAYHVAIGMSEQDEDIAPHMTKEVKNLAKMIQKHTDNGLPLNEIVSMIEERVRLESSAHTFQEWIMGLPITSNEKKLLRSIIEERRVGTITLVDKKTGDDLFVFKIPKAEALQSSTPVWAFNFQRLLQAAIDRSTGKGIQIWFEAQ